MHTNLTFRVTVNAREGSQTGEARKEVKKEQAAKDMPSGKVIYCSEFNKNACTFDDHHQGVFNRKVVTKWHICSKCLTLEGNPKRSHPSVECKSA